MTHNQEDGIERKQFIAGLIADGCCTVSEGTMRAQDLIPKFLAVLKQIAPAEYAQMIVPGCGFAAVPSHALEDDSDEWWGSDDCAYLLNETLFDSLNEHAPEGYHFGSHEGDGACYGFWPNEDFDG